MAVKYLDAKRIRGQYNVFTPWDITDSAYASKSFSVSSYFAELGGIAFKTDGTKMYVSNYASDTVSEFTLGTAWDITTATYVAQHSFTSTDNALTGVFFKSDGTKIFVVGLQNDTVYEFPLSSAWDISSVGSLTDSHSISSQESNPYQLFFKPDGLTMYVIGGSNNVNQYTLNSAWDLSGTVTHYKTFSVSSQDSAMIGLQFSSDGTKMFTAGYTNDKLYQYTLGTAWDLNGTVTYNSAATFTFTESETHPCGIFFNSNGGEFFALGTGQDTVYQYHTKRADDKDTLLTATEGYKAATFDGINDWALSAGSLGITSGTSYCFGGWFYPQAQPESTGMAMWVGNVLLYRYGGRFVTEGNGTHITSTATYADNTWHHFVVNVDSSTATLYIDGANANTSDSDTITGSYTINGIQVGKEGTSTVSEYKGSASDVFVFTRALTAAEIASLSGGAKVSSISQTSIQANYTFDSDFNDSSGNSGRNLTASGNATAGNSVGTSPITTVYSSNLPENTIFEETDTRKAYFLQSAAWLRAKVKSTFEENFDDNDASWQTSGSGASKGLGSHNGSGESGGTMVWVSTHTSGQNPVYTLDLTSLSDITTVASDWTLRFKFIDIVDNSSTANYGSFGVTAGTSNALTSEHHAVCSIGGNEMTLSARNNTHIEPSTGNSIENTAGGNEVRYVEIKSDSGIYTLNVYNNSDYSDTPSTMSTTVSLTGLRYLKLNGKGSNSGYLHVGIDDVEFYDGVVL